MIIYFGFSNITCICSHDGVYASKEQRVAGGGCLDLPAAAAAELGLEEGSLTGTWDHAHNLQIVWKTALGLHPLVEDLVTFMFGVMDDYRVGQASTVFRARAADLGHLILSNKKRQTTRFVRSLVRGLQAYLRNLPTLIHVMSEKYEEAAQANKNTAAREVLGTLAKLRDSRKLLLAVGLAQLLELYTEASLQSQHSRRFPTQAWAVNSEMKAKVAALGERWEWGEEDLRYAGIEAPVKVKDRLVEEGKYRPAVTEASARASRVRRDTDLVKDSRNIKDLFDEEGESVVPLAGESVMEVPLAWRARRGQGVQEKDGRSGDTRDLTEEDVAGVGEELSGLARDIVEEWEKRVRQNPLEKAAFAAFGESYEWGEDRRKVEADGVRAVVSLGQTRKMRELLLSVVSQLSEVQEQKFDVDLMLEGFSSFLKYRTQEQAAMLLGDHEIYEAWYKVCWEGVGIQAIKILYGPGVQWIVGEPQSVL